MGRSWKELKAEGVKRCCATFRGGRRCRRRAAHQDRGGFCRRCDEKIERQLAPYRAMLREAEAEMARPDRDEEDDE